MFKYIKKAAKGSPPKLLRSDVAYFLQKEPAPKMKSLECKNKSYTYMYLAEALLLAEANVDLSIVESYIDKLIDYDATNRTHDNKSHPSFSKWYYLEILVQYRRSDINDSNGVYLINFYKRIIELRTIERGSMSECLLGPLQSLLAISALHKDILTNARTKESIVQIQSAKSTIIEHMLTVKSIYDIWDLPSLNQH